MYMIGPHDGTGALLKTAFVTCLPLHESCAVCVCIHVCCFYIKYHCGGSVLQCVLFNHQRVACM